MDGDDLQDSLLLNCGHNKCSLPEKAQGQSPFVAKTLNRCEGFVRIPHKPVAAGRRDVRARP